MSTINNVNPTVPAQTNAFSGGQNQRTEIVISKLPKKPPEKSSGFWNAVGLVVSLTPLGWTGCSRKPESVQNRENKAMLEALQKFPNVSVQPLAPGWSWTYQSWRTNGAVTPFFFTSGNRDVLMIGKYSVSQKEETRETLTVQKNPVTIDFEGQKCQFYPIKVRDDKSGEEDISFTWGRIIKDNRPVMAESSLPNAKQKAALVADGEKPDALIHFRFLTGDFLVSRIGRELLNKGADAVPLIMLGMDFKAANFRLTMKETPEIKNSFMGPRAVYKNTLTYKNGQDTVEETSEYMLGVGLFSWEQKVNGQVVARKELVGQGQPEPGASRK